MPQLFPFIKELSKEWLQPAGVRLKKNKFDINLWKTRVSAENSISLDSLLPPQDDTDALVSFYLDYFEQIHRIVHIPTFRKDYTRFWTSGHDRRPGMTAMILSMISISACTAATSKGSTFMPSKYRAMAVQWLAACDEWMRQQSSKQGKLLQYQVSCLLYLAKRVNIVRKKWYWKEAGALMQHAVMDELYHDQGSTSESPYMREMKRRIWAVIRELNLQTAFEYGLPSLIFNIHCEATSPTNINDEEFNETSVELPLSRVSSEWTSTSYQYHSSRSWALRLGIAQRLSSFTTPEKLSYEEVLRFTHEINQAIHSLPPCATDDVKSKHHHQFPILSYSFLRFQLQECLLAIHRPYLRRDKSEFWISANLCHIVAREILLQNVRLASLGLQGLTYTREDILLAALTLSRMTISEPQG